MLELDDLPDLAPPDPLPWAAMAGSLLLHVAIVALALLPPFSSAPQTLDRHAVEITLLTSPPPEDERMSSQSGESRDAHRVEPGFELPPPEAPGPEPGLTLASPASGPAEHDRFLSLPAAAPPPSVKAAELAAPESAAMAELERSLALPEEPGAVQTSEFAPATLGSSLPATSPAPQSGPPQTVAAVRAAPPSPPRATASAATAPAGVAQPRAAPPKKADDASARRAQQDYLWHVVRKLSQQRFQPRSTAVTDRGLIVVHLAVGRDGTLRDISLAKSSGYPAFDRDLIDAIRRAAPFAPLPAEIAGDPYTMIVPVSFAETR